MKRWRLGICDREAGYARSLARFLRARGEGRLEVRVFTAKAAAAACLNEGGLDCLLADEECAAQWVSYPGVFVAALSEKDGDGEVPFVGKYQSAERIWKRLLEIGAAGDWEQPSSVGSRKTEIIGICSPSQELKGLVLGLLAGRLLSGTERSLFLTIGEFSALPELLGGGGEGELSELYYCCCQGRLSGGQLRAAACRWGTVDWIAPPERPEDLYRNGRPYEADFFRSLMQTGGYGFLVLELGGGLGGKEELLSACGRLLVPVPETGRENIRTGKLLTWLKEKGYGGKTVSCPLPDLNPREEAVSPERELAGAFGEAVRKLLKDQGYMEGGRVFGGEDQGAASGPAGHRGGDLGRAPF